jgi:2-polyprenyl-3-methyl-5-hydroxy-6-metoxy-1,4-benzoquinol methylase
LKIHKRDKQRATEEQANFFFTELAPYIASLGNNSAVLEVGCGNGVLLQKLANCFINVDFHGLDSFGDGFEDTHQSIKRSLRSGDFEFYNTELESFVPNQKFDVIFSINTVEHLDDWKTYFELCASWLKTGGGLLTFAPNYSFPYETHFGIPILFNKSITYFVFKGHINKFEVINSHQNLWRSLNFVKKTEVLKFLNSIPCLQISEDRKIVERLVFRFKKDSEYSSRHRILAMLVAIIKRFGLLNFLLKIDFLSPYMKICATKK